MPNFYERQNYLNDVRREEREAVIEECAMVADAFSKHFFTTPEAMQTQIVAAIRALKLEP